MKLGIIGAGLIVTELFKFIHEIDDIQITAVCATAGSEEKLKSFCREHRIDQYYVSTEELLKDPNVEVVYVAVPNHLHYPFAKQALEAGRHVICEKPFTATDEEAGHLIRLARERDLILLEAVTTNYLPNMQSIKENLYRLGEIKIVSLNYSQYSSRYDAFKAGTVLPAFDPEMAGGALMDLNIYNINFVVNLFGKPVSLDYRANIQRGIDTSGILTLDYGTFQCVCVGAKDCKAPFLNLIQGDLGCLCIDSGVSEILNYRIITNDLREETFDINPERHRMYYEFAEFARIIKEHDQKKANRMQEITAVTMAVQAAARRKAGLLKTAGGSVRD